ncbi:MAG: translation initiation factor IF-2B subunit delta [Desulfurococcales archaeon ex4484_217_1]|nr:MAG: translation initiation factor IF-2B subunit delta [Desulfurococcales archaeon ex4484_217_1]
MEAKTLVSKLVSNIISWKIRSSTELVEETLNTLECIIKKSKDLNSLVLDIIYMVNEVIKVRPTAAMLINCSRDILLELNNVVNSKPKLPKAKEALLNKIRRIKGRMTNSIERIATIGANRIIPGDIIMTSAYSKTVMKIFEKALEQGKKFEVFVTESRPGDDGKIVASELSKLGLKVTLIVDSAMRYFMKYTTRVLLGAEAVAANGAVISKVGSSLMALIAHEARVRVFVAASTLKFNYETVFGELVRIPQAPEETILPGEVKEKIGGIKTEIPVLDVIPPEYVDAIITEYGVIAPQAIPLLMRDLLRTWPPKAADVSEIISNILEVTKSA